MNRFEDLLRFAVAGLGNWFIEFAVFNLLLLSILDSASISKFFAACVSTATSYVTLKHWAFKNSPNANPTQRFFGFIVINIAAGLLMAVLTWMSLKVFNIHTLVLVNLVSNVFAVMAATIFRYVCYRKWIFVPESIEILSKDYEYA